MPSRHNIPSFVIAAVSDVAAEAETHATLDSLFMHAGASGPPPDASKPAKAQEWLRRTNLDPTTNPLDVLGRIVEVYIEADCEERGIGEIRRERKEKIERALARASLQYRSGGIVSRSVGIASRSLEELISSRDVQAIDEEFDRAIRTIESSPREAVSAASNILESIFKAYIEKEGLPTSKKQDLRGVWSIVSDDLGFDPAKVEDRDLKEILGGLRGVVGGIGALRTHGSSAHGASPSSYKIEPRHARLAVHSAHTIASFVLESWDRRRR